jgi:hypothetical protein
LQHINPSRMVGYEWLHIEHLRLKYYKHSALLKEVHKPFRWYHSFRLSHHNHRLLLVPLFNDFKGCYHPCK